MRTRVTQIFWQNVTSTGYEENSDFVGCKRFEDMDREHTKNVIIMNARMPENKWYRYRTILNLCGIHKDPSRFH